MLQEVKQAVVTFLVQLFAPPNNVNVLQLVNQGSVFLNFNVQVTFFSAQSVSPDPGTPPSPSVSVLSPTAAAQSLATQAATSSTAVFESSPTLVKSAGLQLSAVTLDTTPVAGVYLAPPPPPLNVPNKQSKKMSASAWHLQLDSGSGNWQKIWLRSRRNTPPAAPWGEKAIWT